MKKTFIIPMAFIAASSVSIGTGLIANKVMITNDTHPESMIIDTKAATGTSVTETVGVTTDTTIGVTTSWNEDSATSEVETISYVVKDSLGTTIGDPVVKTVTADATAGDKTDVVILNEINLKAPLSKGRTYTVEASLMDSTPTIIGTALVSSPITTLFTTTTDAKIVVSEIPPTITTIDVTTTWTEHAIEIVDSIVYTITKTDGTIENEKVEIVTPGAQTDSFQFTDLTPGTDYMATAVLSNATGVLAIATSGIITTVPWVTDITKTSVALSATDDSDPTETTITVDTAWTNGVNDKVSKITYITSAVNDKETEPIITTTESLAATATAETKKITGLTAGTEYSIMVIFSGMTDLAGVVNFTTTVSSTIKTAGVAPTITDASVKVGDIKDTTVNVTTTWIDGTTDKATHIKYVATPTGVVTTEDTEAEVAKEIILKSKPISGTLKDKTKIEGLIAETEYTITATLQSALETDIVKGQPDGNKKFTTRSSGLGAGEITGIVIGGIAGVTLLGAGGYWVFTTKFS